MARLSIIVPVYNVEEHLEACIKSFIGETTSDDEVILVEDRSTDGSATLCAILAAQHDNIRIIRHEINKGLSEARNSGIKAASGTYITFVDSDDYLAPGTLAENMKTLTGNPSIDILEYPVSVHHLSKRNYRYTPGNNTTETHADWLHRKGYQHSYACNKIFRRELWEDTPFPAGKYVEDLHTIPYVMEKATHIHASDAGLYYYCERQTSICRTPRSTFYKDHLEASVKLFRHIASLQVLNRQETDILYCETCNPQIIYYTHGGTQNHLPHHDISFSSIAQAPNVTMKIKMLMMWSLGKYYCKVCASIKNLQNR